MNTLRLGQITLTQSNHELRNTGIQHVGIAVSEMDKSLKLYRKLFGLDIPFFDVGSSTTYGLALWWRDYY